MGKREPSYPIVGMWTGTASMENSIEVPLKTKTQLPYDPAIPLLGIYLKKTKTLTPKDTCTPMFNAALFTIAKMLETTQVSIVRWTDKEIMVYISTMEYYSAIK